MADNSQKAKNRYQAVYDQKRLESQQAHQQTDLALEQQKGQVSQNFDKQLEQSIISYRNAHSQAGRQSIRQGMVVRYRCSGDQMATGTRPKETEL